MAKKKAGKKVRAKKAPVRKAAAKKAPRKASLAPVPVKTGRGPGPAEIGEGLVSMFNQGQFKEIEDKWHSPRLVSVEGVGVALAWRGQRAVQAKNEEWMSTHRIHGASAEGPYVGASGFAVKFAMDVEDTTTGSRSMMEEVGVYTVENGKIVREEFMYGKHTPITPGPGTVNGSPV